MAISNIGATEPLFYLRQAADQYGIVLFLTPPADHLGSLYDAASRGGQALFTAEVDAALREVYRRFAIEPDRVALMGVCDTGFEAAFLGYNNPKLFSRIIMHSSVPDYDEETWATANPTAEFLYNIGFDDNMSAGNAEAKAEALRRRGMRTKVVVGFRTHSYQVENNMFIVRWLHESWAMSPAARSSPQAVAKPVPRLTLDALAKLTAFWTRFQQEPESIRTVARQVHLREVVIPMGPVPLSTVIVDMAALAARYPSVARALKAAELTAAQHDAYRVALASARVLHQARQGHEGNLQSLKVLDTLSPSALDAAASALGTGRKDRHGGRWPGQPAGDTTTNLSLRLARLMLEHDGRGHQAIVVGAAGSVLESNEVFLRTQPDALQALKDTGMWTTP